MSVERVNRELDGVKQGVENAPFMTLADSQLDNLSLSDALRAMRRFIGVVRQRYEVDVPAIAATIPATRAVVRDSAEHVDYVVPLDMDGQHPVIQNVQAALHGTDYTMSAVGEQVLTMDRNARQAIGQIALAIESLEQYETARQLLVEGAADAQAGRDRAAAGLQEYKISIGGQ